MNVAVEGFTEPRFDAVREVFAENFRTRGEVGAAFCVYQDGRPVIDLWGGEADPRTGRAWQHDTTAIIYSSTKGLTAGIALNLVDQGLIDLDTPVAEYWPEFAAEGKQAILVRQLLSHRAGLPGIDEPITLAKMEAWHPVVEALAAQRPYWEPDTDHGYHAVTFGWLIGEVIRRVTGKTPGKYLRDEIAGPFDLDVRIGTGPAERHRFAPIIPASAIEPYPDEGFEEFVRQLMELVPGKAGGGARAMAWQERYVRLVRGRARDAMDRITARMLQRRIKTLTQRVFAGVVVTPFDMNDPRLHALEMPAGNGIATARGLARYYAALTGTVDGQRLVSPATIEEATKPWSHGPDRVLFSDTAFGLGFMVPGGLYFDGWGRRTFGHLGSGGAIGLADLDRELAFGYVLNKHNPHPRNPRSDALIRAVYHCLGEG